MFPSLPTSARPTRFGLSLCSLGCALLLPPAALAQSVPGARPDAATLARYDLNRNGVLDPAELDALRADEARNAAAAAAGAAPRTDGIIQLSPFQVSGEADRGYYASNTLSGTRINTKLEDLGASISVVTKQQMQDFALLDINDVFLYEANTEGVGNFTDVVIDRNGNVVDNVAGNPNNANRVRGIGAANTARGNFQTSGRVPFDPVNIDAVEISRGPNSNIFGLGSGSGTVNTIPSTANLSRENATLELRLDSRWGNRALLDVNRPLLRGKLAVRGSVLHQEEEYVRKPSFSRTDRYNAMVHYRPFPNTTLRGSFERYENYARRPNSILPRDAISYWQDSGRPTWDPPTWTVTRNGVRTVVPFNSNQGAETTALGPGLQSGGTGLYARPSIFVDRGAVDLWMINRLSGIPAPTAANPNPVPTPDNQAGNPRFVESAPAPRVGPLAPTVVSITDKSIYDWTETNIAAANWSRDRVNTYTLEFEQFIMNTPRHVLATQLGWFREDAKRYNRSFIGTGGESPMVVFVDVNERLLDGRPNPYFLRPYVNSLEPTIRRQPLKRDIYRAQAAYKLNLAKETNVFRWLGDHAFSAYSEYKDTQNADHRFRDVIISNHAWLPASTNRAAGATAARANYRYYLGDNQGQNIEYGSPAWDRLSGQRNLTWFNAATNQWVSEPATIGEAFSPGVQRFANVIKTYGGVTQNHLFNGRLVTTFGFRKDSNFNRNAATTQLLPDGISPDYSSDDVWPNDWFRRDGKTKTKGAVLKPFRGWSTLDRRAEQGARLERYGADVLRSLVLHYNEADSFIPATIAQNLNLELLPNPSSVGKDYGVSISLSNRFVLRFNTYETKQINSRTGDAGVIATRAGRIDFAFGGNNDQFNLQRQAREWINATTPGLTPEQLNTAVAAVMQVPEDRLAQMNAFPIAETSDVISKGKEIEIAYNPASTWTTKVAVAQQRVFEQGVTPGIQRYIDARRPIWESIIDPRTGLPWFTTRYGSAGTPIAFLNGVVLAPYKLLRANEGKSRPQIREWRVNVASTLQLSAVSDNTWLRRMSVSGALRWEDKGAIGYYTFANDPEAYDPDRRIYDKAHTYVDLGAGYRTRIYGDKVSLRLQLNVRNVFENGRLQPVGALPNGVPHSFRIIDPRLVILTATFSL
jgi:hypothetical protein